MCTTYTYHNVKRSFIVLIGVLWYQLAKIRKIYQEFNMAFQLQIISSYKHLK